MKRRLMTKTNWILVIAGIVVTFLGFVMIRPISTNYDGLYAFISILVTIGGLVLVIIGLSAGFEPKDTEKA
ncbi:MAG: hypothetical protein A2014_04950 [Spirochaetes bacterium GWF1_49_6]|nr:MAG: hypothetical protein A2014_04950 [Spirochaetes bacterium GWF1_49_6]